MSGGNSILPFGPLVVEIENDPDIVRHEHVVDCVVQALQDSWYWVYQAVLLASDYGEPQRSRRRFFIFASLLGHVGFPAPTTSAAPPTVSKAMAPTLLLMPLRTSILPCSRRGSG